MIDLETWGTRPGCDIRSIGAVVFDPIAGKVAIPDGDNKELQFYIATENPLLYNGLRKYSLTRDHSTIEWWNKQPPETQAAFANPVYLGDACRSFSEWIDNLIPVTKDINSIDAPDRELRIWANGPQFDCVILEAVYYILGLPLPWHHRAPRDFRTITEAARMSKDEYCNYGTPHNALDDAIAQAMTVCEAYKRLGLQK